MAETPSKDRATEPGGGSRLRQTRGAGLVPEQPREQAGGGAARRHEADHYITSLGGALCLSPPRYKIAPMPIGTPLHERTFPLCESLNYREWSGYYAVSAYESHHEHEYNAIRSAAALIDVSPLFKYRVTGPDATRLVDRIVTRDLRKVSVGQVIYTPWCDERGKTIDDGTVSRLDENTYRWTAADPSLRWFRQNALG